MPGALSVVAVACLLAVSAGLALLGFGTLSNVWADYRDNQVWVYLVIGLPELAGSVAALLAAVHVWRSRGRADR